LSPDVERFIRQNLDSIEQLEMLVLLRLQQPRRWKASELALEMRTTEGSAATRLRGLVQRGIVREVSGTSGADATYEYAPADEAMDATIGAVATAYVTRRYVVIEAIVGNPKDKIQLFADAFRLRKGKGDD